MPTPGNQTVSFSSLNKQLTLMKMHEGGRLDIRTELLRRRGAPKTGSDMDSRRFATTFDPALQSKERQHCVAYPRARMGGYSKLLPIVSIQCGAVLAPTVTGAPNAAALADRLQTVLRMQLEQARCLCAYAQLSQCTGESHSATPVPPWWWSSMHSLAQRVADDMGAYHGAVAAHGLREVAHALSAAPATPSLRGRTRQSTGSQGSVRPPVYKLAEKLRAATCDCRVLRILDEVGPPSATEVNLLFDALLVCTSCWHVMLPLVQPDCSEHSHAHSAPSCSCWWRCRVASSVVNQAVSPCRFLLQATPTSPTQPPCKVPARSILCWLVVVLHLHPACESSLQVNRSVKLLYVQGCGLNEPLLDKLLNVLRRNNIIGVNLGETAANGTVSPAAWRNFAAGLNADTSVFYVYANEHIVGKEVKQQFIDNVRESRKMLLKHVVKMFWNPNLSHLIAIGLEALLEEIDATDPVLPAGATL